MTEFVPDLYDVLTLDIDTQPKRTVLVITAQDYNVASRLMLCCPVSSQTKGYPFEVTLPLLPGSVVLADQIYSVDWPAANATKIGTVSPAVFEEVTALIGVLIRTHEA